MMAAVLCVSLIARNVMAAPGTSATSPSNSPATASQHVSRLSPTAKLTGTKTLVAPADKNKSQTQCNGRRDQVFVAHEDDDLLFMNPDIHDTIRAGGCIQVVYLTAGERGEGVKYMSEREDGVRAAYALMAGVANVWDPAPLLINKVQIAQYSLARNPRVSLVFMRLKDPWLNKGWGDLTPLSRLEIQPQQMAQALGEYFETYTRESMVRTLSGLILRFEPGKIRRMDDNVQIPYNKLCWRCIGHDHPDHIASARLVRDAMAVTSGNFEAISYVDYPNQERPVTLTLKQLSEKSRIFNLYAQYDYLYCSVPMNCKEPLGPAALWAERQYYSTQSDTPVSVVHTEGTGSLLFTRGEYSNAAAYWSERDARWTVLGGLMYATVKPFIEPSGRVSVFARDGQGQLYFRRARTTSLRSEADWSPWYRIKVPLTTQPQIVSSDKELNAVAMGADGFYYYFRSQNMQNWQFSRLPVLKTASQTFSFLQVGQQQVVLAQTLKGEFWMTVHHQKTGWTPWTIAAGPDGQGGLFALVPDSKTLLAYYRNRTDGRLNLAVGALDLQSSGSTLRWTSYRELGPEFQGSPAILKSSSGTVIVATMSRTGKSIWTLIGDKESRIKGPFASVPALMESDGAVMLYARRANDNRWIQQYAAMRLEDDDWKEAATMMAPPFYGGHSFDGTSDIPEEDQAQQRLQRAQETGDMPQSVVPAKSGIAPAVGPQIPQTRTLPLPHIQTPAPGSPMIQPADRKVPDLPRSSED